MNYTVNQIEDAIKETLENDETLSGYVKKVFILPSLDQQDLEKLAHKGPAIGVIGISGEYDADVMGIMDETGGFAVVALNQNLRSDVAGLRGQAEGEKGTWDIIADCRKCLNASKLDLDIFDCVPKRRSLLFASVKGAACMLELIITWRHTN